MVGLEAFAYLGRQLVATRTAREKRGKTIVTSRAPRRFHVAKQANSLLDLGAPAAVTFGCLNFPRPRHGSGQTNETSGYVIGEGDLASRTGNGSRLDTHKQQCNN